MNAPQHLHRSSAMGSTVGHPSKQLGFLLFTLLLGRPFGRTGGLLFAREVILFFSRRNLRALSVDHRETSPHDRNLCRFYKLTKKFGELSPLKNWGPKHAKFRSILYNLRIWSQISTERLKISKIGKLIHRRQFLLRYMKKVRWTLVH